MFAETRHQAALDRHANLLEEAAIQRGFPGTARPPAPWFRAVGWRPVQFTLRLPVLLPKQPTRT